MAGANAAGDTLEYEPEAPALTFFGLDTPLFAAGDLGGKADMQNAVSACSEDPRFPEVEEEELERLVISVDVLGEVEPVKDTTELDPQRYGVIVSCDGRRGLLLPDLEGVDTVDEQIAIARRKGGISKEEPITLQRFEVVRHV